MKKAFLTLMCAKGEGSELLAVTKGMQTVAATVMTAAVTVHTPVSASSSLNSILESCTLSLASLTVGLCYVDTTYINSTVAFIVYDLDSKTHGSFYFFSHQVGPMPQHFRA